MKNVKIQDKMRASEIDDLFADIMDRRMVSDVFSGRIGWSKKLGRLKEEYIAEGLELEGKILNADNPFDPTEIIAQAYPDPMDDKKSYYTGKFVVWMLKNAKNRDWMHDNADFEAQREVEDRIDRKIEDYETSYERAESIAEDMAKAIIEESVLLERVEELELKNEKLEADNDKLWQGMVILRAEMDELKKDRQ